MAISHPHASERPSTIGVIRAEITLNMAIAGAVLIGLWMEGDPETRALAADDTDLACLVFAAMRREECKNPQRTPG